MNPLRYKTLLTYLPGMASVVNAFQSPQVQASVYEMLMEALDTKLEAEGLGRGDQAAPALSASQSNPELTHELVEGESIHSEPQRRNFKATATVFS